MEIALDPIPSDLKSRAQWIYWREERKREGESTKVPYQSDGRYASSTNDETWLSYDAMILGFRPELHSGIGFVFSSLDPLVGIDLDGCIDEQGEIAEWAAHWLGRLDSYSEISPSGTGIKVWAIGRIAKSLTCKISGEQHAKKSPGVEIYDRGRYFAVTGQRLDQFGHEPRECQEAIDDLVAWMEWMRPAPVFSAPHIAPHNPADGQRPGDDYNAHGDVRSLLTKHGWQQQTNGSNEHWTRPGKTSGCSATLRQSDRVLYCFSANAAPLEAGKAYAPFALYTLYEHGGDFALASAQLRSEGFGDERFRDSGPVVDLSGITAPRPTIAASDSPEADEVEPDSEIIDDADLTDPGDLPARLLDVPGLMGDVIQYTLRTSLYPQPMLALSGALALMSTLTGRRIEAHFGCRTNLYIVSMAPSGCGKDRPRQVNRSILEIAAPNMLGPERIGSAAGLIKWLSSEGGARLATLFQIDEFGKFVQACKDDRAAPHMRMIVEDVLKLWSSAGSRMIPVALVDPTRSEPLDCPHFILHGSCVPDGFWHGVKGESFRDGLLGRMLVFESRLRPKPNDDATYERPPGSILERAKAWYDLPLPEASLGEAGANLAGLNEPSRAWEWTISDDVRLRIRAHRNAVHDRSPLDGANASSIWQRANENAIKLALIHAASRIGASTVGEIDHSDWEWGKAMSNWCARRMIAAGAARAAESDWDDTVKRVLGAIGEKWTTKRNITRKTQFIRRQDREAALVQLAESEHVEIKTMAVGKTNQGTIVYKRKKEKKS